MKRVRDQVSVENSRAFLDFFEALDPLREHLLALMIFAIARRDANFCDALGELRKISGVAAHRGEVINQIDEALLERVNQICTGDERIWWERSLEFAKREGDGTMYQGLVDLIERRVAI